MIVVAVAAGILWLLSVWAGVSAFRVQGLVHRLRRLVVCCSCAVAGILLTALLTLMHAFQAFAGETLVAQVTTRRLSPEEFELTYIPAGQAGGMARTIQLRGDQWSISGGVIKWHPWFTALGLPSYHRPMRLSGQFSSLEQQRSHYPTVYPLAPEVGPFWEAFYWPGPYLPFVDGVYGSAAYVYVEPQAVQEIYVSPSGYLIKRVSNTSGS